MAWVRGCVLGRGACSTVFLGISTVPQRGFVKVLAIKSSRPFMSDALQKEESILKSLIGCPEVLQLHGSQITMVNGFLTHSLFLDFAPYGSLSNLLKKTPLLESEVRAYTRMLLKGLSCIHQRGIVHCDLKPDNILLFPPLSQEDGVSYHLKIADFGLSKTDKESLNTEFWKFRFRGTPLYMSPESIAFGDIGTALDIWSLGCIVIEMITRVPAWWNLTTTKALMIKLVVEKQAPQIPKGMSQNCIDFLSKCFLKDPRNRWTADMLLNHPFVLSSSNQSRAY